MCVPLPEGLDDATAAGIPNPAMSSWVALITRAKFVSGETVLILGATGFAGQLAVQIAKRLRARRVIAAGRNPQALEALKHLGADAVVSLDQEHDALMAAFRSEYANAGVDVALDYLWGAPAECLLEAISQRGLRTTASRVRFVFRLAKALDGRSAWRRRLCAVRRWNCWGAVSAAPLSIRSGRLS